MAIWLVRAGGQGQFEPKFITDKRIYVTWDGLNKDLGKLDDRAELQQLLTEKYPDAKPKAILNWVSQLWPFAQVMQVGDFVVLPSKTEPVIHIGEITGDYHFEKSGPDPFFHWRSVKWIGEAIPRSHFSQDLLYSFGAFLTICRIQRNNAEQRIAAMRANGWKPETISHVVKSVASDTTEDRCFIYQLKIRQPKVSIALSDSTACPRHIQVGN